MINFAKFLDTFTTDELTDQQKEIFMSRKAAFNKMGGLVKKASIAALPISLLTAVSNKAMAQEGTTAVEILNYALTLELLEYNFYNHCVESEEAAQLRTDLGADLLSGITLIRDHELAHKDLLAGAVSAASGTPVEYVYDDFDFTAGGLFADVYSSSAVFLAVAQAFEDTGVRAYKGQAGNLLGNELLGTALRIHSVEARHAAYIRMMRIMQGTAVNADEKEWVTTPDYSGLDLGGAASDDQKAATAAVYAGEDNTTHLEVDATTLTDVEALGVQEGWDEPLSMTEVNAIAANFIKS